MSKEPEKSESEPSQLVSAFTTPLSQRGWPRWLVYALSIVGLVYLLNPTAGLLEFIPDFIPGLGNLDEGVALLLIWSGVVEYFEGSKSKPQKPGAASSNSAVDSPAETATPADSKDDEDVVDGKWEEDSSS